MEYLMNMRITLQHAWKYPSIAHDYEYPSKVVSPPLKGLMVVKGIGFAPPKRHAI